MPQPDPDGGFGQTVAPPPGTRNPCSIRALSSRTRIGPPVTANLRAGSPGTVALSGGFTSAHAGFNLQRQYSDRTIYKTFGVMLHVVMIAVAVVSRKARRQALLRS